jgi:hypothetical protein
MVNDGIDDGDAWRWSVDAQSCTKLVVMMLAKVGGDDASDDVGLRDDRDK